MCGILGGFWVKPKIDIEKKIKSAILSMRHRGPNDCGLHLHNIHDGTLGFGHTRLSIIDLTSAGHQPMHTEDKRWTIVFNGEIYNYRELGQELKDIGRPIKTNTDTEILLQAWIEWGENCLSRLIGMFAFSIFDRAAGTIVCARDAFGIKPLLYTYQRGEFAFASELRAVLELTENKPTLNWQRAYDYLVNGDYDSQSDTFINKITHLLPGHLVQYNLKDCRLDGPKRWWYPKIEEHRTRNFDDAVYEVREAFYKNIKLHLRSDVSLGATLSGGIDSSSIICAMRRLEPNLPIHTFSYIPDSAELSEEVWIDLVNTKVGAISHKTSFNSQDLFHDIDDLITAQGEPFGTTSIYAQYRVYKLAKENGITVILDGQGADEMMAGYNGYVGQRIQSLIDEGEWMRALKFLNGWSKWPDRSKFGGIQRYVGQIVGADTYNILRRLAGDNPVPKWLNTQALKEHSVDFRIPQKMLLSTMKGRRLVAELSSSLFSRGLVSLLRHSDRNSMRFSVESRVPYLTLDLSKILLSLPEDYLISSQGETKKILREAMRGLVPQEILDRRDKNGFYCPQIQKMSGSEKVIRETILSDWGIPILNHGFLSAEYDRSISKNNNNPWLLWRIINFVKWYNIFIK